MAPEIKTIFGTMSILIFFCMGCAKPKEQALFPLKEGNTWQYLVRSGLQTQVNTIRVSKHVPVGDYDGWLLTSSTGDCSAAWTRSELLVSRLASTQFLPPLPLLSIKKETGQRKWKGTILFQGTSYPCHATLCQDQETYLLGAKPYATLCVKAEFNLPGKNVELLTWFCENFGILCQQQRTNNYLDLSMEYLKGP